ncbi:MAG: PEP-CTERM sorting domain-containing protein [Candidatus Nealsonbacteria bacterium]|nr:PEP-CTERM sorting domain-containing protein [Candidatus Nealsonbacteria bacterium]
MRNVAVALVVGLALCTATQSAFASISFVDPIDLKLSRLGIGLSDVDNVTVMDFFGRSAINTVDTDGSMTSVVINGNTVYASTVGDRSRVVGGAHARFLDLAGSYELTIVLRDWNSTVVSTYMVPPPDQYSPTEWVAKSVYDSYSPAPVTDLGTMPMGTGFLDLYLDVSEDFSEFDVNTAANGTWLATFGVTGYQSNTDSYAPMTKFTMDDSSGNMSAKGETRVGLELLAQKNGGDNDASTDIITSSVANGIPLIGSTLTLATFAASTESPQVNQPSPMVGIYGGSDPVDILNLPDTGLSEDWNPATSATIPTLNDFALDHVMKYDSSNTFGIVPEPASMLVWGGLCLVGLAAVVRRRRK